MQAMYAEGGLASLPQTNYYKTPDLLQPVNQQPQPTQPVMQPFTRQRVQAVIPNAWDKKPSAPQTHVDPVILDTVTKLSQGITPLEGQNRGGSGNYGLSPNAGIAASAGSGFPAGLAPAANTVAQALGNMGFNTLSHAVSNASMNGAMSGTGAAAGSSTGPDGATNSRDNGGWGGRDAGGGTSGGSADGKSARDGGGFGGTGSGTGGDGGGAGHGSQGQHAARGGYISHKKKR